MVYGDGSEEVRRGGTRAWRNNNPGNLRNSEFSQDQGSLGEAGGFAVFRNEDAGQTALVNLLNTNTYQQLTVNEAISRFAPPKENDTASYQRAIREGLGVDGATELSNLTPEQIQALSAIIRGVEGWTPGTVIRR